MSNPIRLALKLYQGLWAGLDWVYPPVCGGCETPGKRWCVLCENSVQRLKPPLCSICGEPQFNVNVCEDCRLTPPPFAALRSWGVFGGALRNAIHRLKYEQDIALADVLARPLIRAVEQYLWGVDLVTPAPLSVQRLRERGYNQAALLARPVAMAHGLAFRPRALQKIRDTRPQVGLHAMERRQNVIGAYRADSKLVRGRRVLLIDDVATTGATLSACAAALLEAGAERVYALTLARSAFT